MSTHDKIALRRRVRLQPGRGAILAAGKSIVEVNEGHSPEEPAFFARAYVPIMVDGLPVAVVAAYVDETQLRTRFYSTFLVASASLCLLTGLAFVIPAIARYRRTQEKQLADRRIRFLASSRRADRADKPRLLIEKLEKALAVLPVIGKSLAVHFVDLDRFKEVNDTIGHDGGDFLLRIVAERLRAAIRIDDVVARLGGDEFVVVQCGVADKDKAEDFAQRIILALTAPIPFGRAGTSRHRQHRSGAGARGRHQSRTIAQMRGSCAVQGQG